MEFSHLLYKLFSSIFRHSCDKNIPLSSRRPILVNKSAQHFIYNPKTITTIGGGAFCENKNFKNVIFEENSQLTTIGSGAFRDCPSLEKIILPPSVKEIQVAAFANFSQLSYLVYCGTTIFPNSNIIYPKNNTEILDLKIFVVYGLYLNNYFGKYRVISTSECISDRTIKAKFLTCFMRNRYLRNSILILCFMILK